MIATDLPDIWRSTAVIFREHEENSLALAYENCADALEEALAQQRDELLTLTQAAKLSGYSADHLGRLVRQGKIRNAGRPGAPRIARRDVPRKSGTVPPAAETREIDFRQIVRSAVSEGA